MSRASQTSHRLVRILVRIMCSSLVNMSNMSSQHVPIIVCADCAGSGQSQREHAQIAKRLKTGFHMR